MKQTPTTMCECGATEFKEINESHSLHLYAHTDRWVQCRECGEILTHGVPDSHEDGMAFYDVDNGLKYERPTCCRQPMYPTKMWRSSDKLQFKCGECYQVRSEEPEDADNSS